MVAVVLVIEADYKDMEQAECKRVVEASSDYQNIVVVAVAVVVAGKIAVVVAVVLGAAGHHQEHIGADSAEIYTKQSINIIIVGFTR